MAVMSSKKGHREVTARRKRASRRTKIELIALILAVALGFGGWYAWRESSRPGQPVESMGRAHVPEETPSPGYNSSPPTSGPHAGATAWGEHLAEIPNINQVHNLEHGGVLIQYNCQLDALRSRCDEVLRELRSVLRTAREEIDPKIILAPYTKMDQPTALTAWTRLEYLSEPDSVAIHRFIRRNINRAPEEVE